MLPIVALTGCHALFGLLPVDGDAGVAPDAPDRSDASDAPAGCVTSALIGLVCPPPATGPLSIVQNEAINTGMDARCQTFMLDGREACLITATEMSITARLAVLGARPLILHAEGGIVVGPNGVVDASSSSARSDVGAGSVISCSPADAPDQTQPDGGAGGGAGGSFRGRGGVGGKNDAGVFAVPELAVVASTLIGGCRGGRGGDDLERQGGGAGGRGGGAVHLIARTSITVGGGIYAWGGGGRAGTFEGIATPSLPGGGGGGSGGMIVLEAPSLQLLASARLLAHGGAGGGGANAAANGTIGGEMNPAAPTMRAQGGGGALNAGTGGHASGGTELDGLGAGLVDAAGGGGGGGGGGAGFILYYSADVVDAAIAYPPPLRP